MPMDSICIKFDYLRYYMVKQMIEMETKPIEIKVTRITVREAKVSAIASMKEVPQRIAAG